MRRARVFALAGLLALGAVPVAVVPAAAAPAATPGGTYVALANQSRVVDTRTGADGNHRGAVLHGHGIVPTIGGKGGVPADAAAVAVTITVLSPTGTGGIVGYVGTRPATTNLVFSTGHPVTGTAILRLSGRRVVLFNTASSGTVQIVVDVSGYYTAGPASSTDPGVYHAVPRASRVVNTLTGADGNRRGALPAGGAIRPTIGGHAGVPADAGAAAVTITVLDPTRAGTLVAYRPDEPRHSEPILHFRAGERVSTFAVVRLSGGATAIGNTSAGTVHVLVDVSGYYNIGFAQTARAFQTVVQTRAQVSRAAANGTVTVRLAGRGGVPLRGVSAVLVTLHVGSPARAGGLQAWRYGAHRPPRSAVLQFGARQTTSNTVLVPVSPDGRFSLHNSSAGRTTIVVDIDGYVPSTAGRPATSHATGRYADDLTTDVGDDVTKMAHHGCADAEAGYTFVLLDLGAQSISSPTLGKDNPGVVVAKAAGRVPLTYLDLVEIVDAYLDGYHDCALPAQAATVAVGTNNDGVWDPKEKNYYASDARGADWADLVVDKLEVDVNGQNLTVVGSVDVEPGFASTAAQAQEWTDAFLDHVYLGADTALVFNGSADGCPVNWTRNATCGYGWTARQLYAMAAGRRTVALPQVYFGSMATQWAEIDATGGGRLRFLGALSEHLDGSLSPAQSWTALERAISSVTATPIGRDVVQIKDA